MFPRPPEQAQPSLYRRNAKPKNKNLLVPGIFCALVVVVCLMPTGSNFSATYGELEEIKAKVDKTKVILPKSEADKESAMDMPRRAETQRIAPKPVPKPVIVDKKPAVEVAQKVSSEGDWCQHVKKVREGLDPALRIDYQCEKLKPATSAIVCMLTDGVSDGKASRVVFTATNYLHGAMALGASLIGRIDPAQTHQLLLLREGFVLAPEDVHRLESVGWTIGTAPDFKLKKKYIPSFARYKTTYTKVFAIGLAEYKCAMLMDADTLAIGDLKDIMSCNIFSKPQHRVAGTLDWYRKKWYYFNTGSILWRPSNDEMKRVYGLSQNDTWMQRFSSDQDFLNAVYPERKNKARNKLIAAGEPTDAENGKVMVMPWDYNAQTHAEVENAVYWKEHRHNVRILHYTEKKGWQCKERHEPLQEWEDMVPTCSKNKTIADCFCLEAHLYWDALSKAKALANEGAAVA